MSNSLLTKSYRAIGAIAGFLILKHAAGGLALATAATDPLVGASGSLGAPDGGMVDVDHVGIGEVQLGGDVTAGDPLTANAASKAVKAVQTGGAIVRTIGFALVDGSADDVIPYTIAPGMLAKSAA